MSQVSGRVRMSPEDRREQLLALGVRLLATRPLDEVTIELLSEQAGVSRGLLYHYFETLQDFHRAVVRRAVADLYAVTAPTDGDDLQDALTRSLAAYVDFVRDNRPGYVSLVRAAAGGDPELREIYEQACGALTDRIFDSLGDDGSPTTRLLARGWAALVESVVLEWTADPQGVDRDELLAALAGALVGVLAAPQG